MKNSFNQFKETWRTEWPYYLGGAVLFLVVLGGISWVFSLLGLTESDLEGFSNGWLDFGDLAWLIIVIPIILFGYWASKD